ncbi:MAG: alkaline phosphatase [Actinobacteria bacterium 69-20]|jgi:membrane protein DedA with SNARE-associated domain|nr:DedA family protein [Actinomycetota bacterium]OJV23147.1 MAG: alkaline phosphatase [Actinobacteria bacterium 69-20]
MIDVGQLPGAFGAFTALLDRYGYIAVAAAIFLEDFGIPVPGETILIAAAVDAGAGGLNVIILGLVAWVAAIAGDNVGYLIGHAGGRPLALKYGKYVFLTESRLTRVEGFFARYGGAVVTFARFVEGLRQLNGIAAGISKMAWVKFLAFNLLGAALWCGLWITLGYLAGDHISAFYDVFRRYEVYVGIGVVVAIALLVARGLVRYRRRRHQE